MINLRLPAEHARRYHGGETGPGALARTIRELVDMQIPLLRCPPD